MNADDLDMFNGRRCDRTPLLGTTYLIPSLAGGNSSNYMPFGTRGNGAPTVAYRASHLLSMVIMSTRLCGTNQRVSTLHSHPQGRAHGVPTIKIKTQKSYRSAKYALRQCKALSSILAPGECHSTHLGCPHSQ